MQEEKARPPYVTFEVKAVEDRQGSIDAGHYVSKDVDFAFVTPQGSKDRIERVVTDWFENLELQVQSERFPRAWLNAYKDSYKAWKEGREIPLNGTAILTWPVLSPSQAKALVDAGIRTVEDLAEANEEGLSRVGMGARALKDKAIAWVKQASGNGKATEELVALKVRAEQAEASNKELQAQLTKLAAEVAALTKK